MTTPVWFTGFEYGVATVTANGGGLFNAVNGSPVIQNTTVKNGSYALKCAVSGTPAVCNVAKTLSTSTLVGRIYFQWHVAPASATRIMRFTVAVGSSPSIYFDPVTHKVYPHIVTPGTKSQELLQDTWYRFDFYLDCSTGSTTFDLQVDGVAIPQFAITQTATTFNGIYMGFMDSVTAEYYYDDVIVSYDSADFPIGDGATEILVPNADGTNNSGTVIKNTAGSVIDGTAGKTAWTELDELPPTNTSYVQQTGTGSNYAEVHFTDTTQSNFLGVMGILAYHAAGSNTCTGATIVRRSDGTEISVYGTAATPSDMSESVLFYKSALITPPGSGLSAAEINSWYGRVGYSSDANPVPYWDAFYLEVAYIPSAGSTILVDDTGAGADDVSLTAGIIIGDTGSSIDSVLLEATAGVTETGSGLDSPGVAVSFILADSGSGVDNAVVGAVLAITDTASGSDAAGIGVYVPVIELGQGQDLTAVAAFLNIGDSASGLDNAVNGTGVVISETGSGTEALTIVSLVSLADTASGLDAPSLSAALSVADLAHGLDAPGVNVSLTIGDLGSGLDAPQNVTMLVPIQELAQAADAISQLLVALAVGDTASALDAVSVMAAGVKPIVTVVTRFTARQVSYVCVRRSMLLGIMKRDTLFSKSNRSASGVLTQRSITFELS